MKHTCDVKVSIGFNVFSASVRRFAAPFLLLCFICFPLLEVSASTLYVSPYGSHVSPYSDWTRAATNIQDAVLVAAGGDTVLVTNGVYLLSECVEITNGITLQSVNGCHQTIVDGQEAVRCFYIAHSNAVIEGFTITGGESEEGGGIYISEEGTVRSCLITENSSPYGGGVYFYYGGTVYDCMISDNRATSTDYEPAGNFFSGGGVFFWCGGTVQDCTIAANSVTSSNCSPSYTYYCYGGGVCAEKGGLVENCLIVSNSAVARNSAQGGGVKLHEGGIVKNCIIYNNSADAWGTTYATGDGGGVYCDLGGTVQNCTIASNSVTAEYSAAGGGIYCFRGGTLRNTISYFNVAAGAMNNFENNTPSDQTYEYCCTKPIVTGTGNISDNPVFFDVGTGNCRLHYGSPCIDTGGTNEAPDLDIDCNSRPLDGDGDGLAVVDIGAYEYTTNRLSAPLYVSASDGLFRDKVRITWHAVSGADVYEVWRHTTDNFLEATRIANNVIVTNYDDSSATSGSTNYYFVKMKTSEFSTPDTGYTGGRVVNDFDGDGESDLTVYHQSSGYWFVLESSSASLSYTKLGGPGYDAVPGDFDGDKKADQAVYHENTGYWYILLSGSGGSLSYTPFGALGYEPVSGDFDADGKTDLAVYQESTGYWYIYQSSDYSLAYTQLGASGYTPVPGDYDGDGFSDIAVYHENTGYWYILLSGSGGSLSYTPFGALGYEPVSGDFDADSKTDLAVYQESTGYWYIYQSSDYSLAYAQFGASGYTPVPGDYDGDGTSDMTVYHESSGYWYSLLSGSGYLLSYQKFGESGYEPVK